MKKLFFSLALVALTGCMNFHAISTGIDPETHTPFTNEASGTFLFAKGSAEKLEVAARTKTTSKLIGSKNTETSGDAETIKAVADAMERAMAIGARALVKP